MGIKAMVHGVMKQDMVESMERASVLWGSVVL